MEMDLTADSNVFRNGAKEKYDIKININKPEYLKFSTSHIRECLKIDIVDLVEKDLDFNEKVSLMFLIYEETELEYALQRLLLYLNHNKNANLSLLTDWCRTNPENWSNKLFEALMVIESFDVISKIGFKKNEVIEHFKCTKYDKSVNLSPIRICLYKFCESLSKPETDKLMKSLITGTDTGTHIGTNNWDVKAFDKYLEISLLYLMSRSVINCSENHLDLRYLLDHLKKVELFDAREYLMQYVFKKTKELGNSVNKSVSSKNVESQFQEAKRVDEEETTYYKIVDPQDMGICLIINQKTFERKENITDQENLSFRAGSDFDSRMLKETFEKYYFTVIEKSNVKDVCEMERIIEEVMVNNAFKIKNHHSAFFLFILSHGDRDAIYGANSELISLSKIEEIILNFQPLLANKPKILIVQACQGKYLNLVLETDGPGEGCRVSNQNTNAKLTDPLENSPTLRLSDIKNTTPSHCDLLVCLGTVPGYESYRDPERGTLFIQALCSHIIKHSDEEDLDSIITMLTNYFKNQRFPRSVEDIDSGEISKVIATQIPQKRSNLSKKFYFKEPKFLHS